MTGIDQSVYTKHLYKAVFCEIRWEFLRLSTGWRLAHSFVQRLIRDTWVDGKGEDWEDRKDRARAQVGDTRDLAWKDEQVHEESYNMPEWALDKPSAHAIILESRQLFKLSFHCVTTTPQWHDL